jgi:hypothetical protein
MISSSLFFSHQQPERVRTNFSSFVHPNEHFETTLRLPTVPLNSVEMQGRLSNLLLIGGYYFLLPRLIVFPLANEFFLSLRLLTFFLS